MLILKKNHVIHHFLLGDLVVRLCGTGTAGRYYIQCPASKY